MPQARWESRPGADPGGGRTTTACRDTGRGAVNSAARPHPGARHWPGSPVPNIPVENHRPTAGAAAPAAVVAAPVEEKTEFTVVLKEVPADKKLACIKEVRTITGVGLKEAKDLVEAAPKEIVKDVAKDEAEKVKKQLEDAGAVVELK